tara:strand:- start:66 stop:203 length:138 start_codon:yes stop_codon:yes gene_type:complete
MYKNLVVNAFGDVVERTDYGTHKNQIKIDFGKRKAVKLKGFYQTW